MASRFWVGGTGTWDAADTTHWATSSGGAGGASVPVAGDTVTLDANSGGGTITVNHATLSLLTLTMGAFTGTLDFSANNNNVTLTAGMVLTGTGTRTLNMGDGTWTFTQLSGTPWDSPVVTNLTLNCNGSTIALTATAPNQARTFQSGGKTFNVITVAATTTGFPLIINGGPTIATFTITEPINLLFAGGTTTTITNAFTWSGDSSHRFVIGANSGSAATIAATGGGSIDWAMIFAITFTTGTVNATNSYNLRSTSGVTITEPSAATRAYVIGG